MRRAVLILVLVVVGGLVPEWVASASACDACDKVPVFAAVFGTNVLGPDGSPGAGDPDARGSLAMVTPGPTEVCFGLNVLNVGKVTAVQVRRGTATETGPVVFNLAPLPSSGKPSSGCVSSLPASVVPNLRSDLAGFYLNVTTTDFPNGAVRGQLFATPTGGGTNWGPYLAGGGLLILGLVVGFLAGRRRTREGTPTPQPAPARFRA